MKANGGKRISFLESAHQSYLKTAIAMPSSGHLKNSVDQCNETSQAYFPFFEYRYSFGCF